MEKDEPTFLDKIGGCGCLLVIALAVLAGLGGGLHAGLAVLVAAGVIVFIVASFYATVASKDPNARFGGGCVSFLVLIVVGVIVYYNCPEYLGLVVIFSVFFIIAILIANVFAAARRRKNKTVAKHFQQAIESSGIDLDNLDE